MKILAAIFLIPVLWSILLPSPPSTRFVPVANTVGLALDTKTGKYCRAWPDPKMPDAFTFLPQCSALAKSWFR